MSELERTFSIGDGMEEAEAYRTLINSSQARIWHQFPNHQGSDVPSHPSSQQSGSGSNTSSRWGSVAEVTHGSWRSVQPGTYIELWKTPFPFNSLDTHTHIAPRMPDVFCPRCPPQSSGLQSWGWGRLESTFQTQPSPPSVAQPQQPAFEPRWPGLKLLYPSTSSPADPETLPSSRWPAAPPSPKPGRRLRLQASGFLPPLPVDGPRQLHTHWATRGGDIWSQCEVREPPPFPGKPAQSSVNHVMAGTGLGARGKGASLNPCRSH